MKDDQEKKYYRIKLSKKAETLTITQILRRPTDAECTSAYDNSKEAETEEEVGYVTYAIAPSQREALEKATKTFEEFFEAKANKYISLAKKVMEEGKRKEEFLYYVCFCAKEKDNPVITAKKAAHQTNLIIEDQVLFPIKLEKMRIFVKAFSEEEAVEKAKKFFNSAIKEQAEKALRDLSVAETKILTEKIKEKKDEL